MKKIILIFALIGIIVYCSTAPANDNVVYTYNNCKVVGMTREYVNDKWRTTMTFECDSNRMTGTIATSSATRISRELFRGEENSFTFLMKGNRIYY